MMARKTRKYRAGRSAYCQIAPDKSVPRDNSKLYQLLEDAGYWWQSKSGQWTVAEKPSTSIFEDNTGEATGIVKIRIMCHPHDLKQATIGLKASEHFRIAEISESYPNRKGSGSRVYVDAVLEDFS